MPNTSSGSAGRGPSGSADPGSAFDGQAEVDRLAVLLDLERLEDNLFRGVSPEISLVRVFGGQVAAQALAAAGRTTSAERRVHSLHGYFLRPGDPAVPIVYDVDRTRDGHSFTTRRVTAIQHGQPIFAMSASFQIGEPGVDHADPMPAVPAPEALPTLSERMAPFRDQLGVFARIRWPFDIRYVSDPPWQSRLTGAKPGAHSRVWFRAGGRLADDPLLHVCVLAYLSDMTLLDSVLVAHGIAAGFDHMQLASLDHAMWFHRPIRVDDWILYDSRSPSASGARGLATGHFFAADGQMLATVVQEGLVRLR